MGFVVIDFVLVAISIMSSYKIYRVLEIGRSVFYPKIGIVPTAIMLSALTVFVMWIYGAYRNESSVLNVGEIKSVFKGITISFLLFACLLVFGKIELSRYVVASSYISAVLLVIVERSILYHLIPSSKTLREFRRRILIYGAGELGSALFREICNSPRMGLLPVGFVDDDPDKGGRRYCESGFRSEPYTVPVLGTGDNVGKLVKLHRIDEIILAISNINNDTCIKILDKLKKEKVKVSFIPNLYKVFVHRVSIGHIGPFPVAFEHDGEVKRAYLAVKRFLDLIMSIALLILLSPLFLVLALAIKFDSKGPVFFKQNRVGKNGKLFEIYKFRSMRTDADPYSVNPTEGSDPRVTRMGRLLRKTSLDELPQLINVLKGEMAFVGPRPEMPFIVETYNGTHRERLKVLPGITGLWQLSGDRKKAIHENMDYDLYYIKNMSLSLDVAILIETLIFAFRGI